MKITPKLIASAPNVINPEGQLTLVLRNQGIIYLENLGPSSETYSVIDLTNNDIIELSGIPDHGAVNTILLANNNISSLGESLAIDDGLNVDSKSAEEAKHTLEYETRAISTIKSLSLVNNNVSSFAEVAKLQRFENLENLLLLGNSIAEEHHYRSFTIWLLPKLRMLDGEKVKTAERAAAQELFGTSLSARTPAADALLHGNSQIDTAPKAERLMKSAVRKLSADEKAKLLAELELALSMEVIERISHALKNGYVE